MWQAYPSNRHGSKRNCFCSTSNPGIPSSQPSSSPASSHPTRSNQERQTLLLVPHGYLPTSTRLPSNLHNRKMQSAVLILHARRRSPTIATTTSPHNPRNIPPLLRLCAARSHQDPAHRRRAHRTARYPPAYAPDWLSAFSGTARAMPDDERPVSPSKVGQHGRSGPHWHKPQSRHPRPFPIPDHDTAKRLRGCDEEH